jgi:hypothetical protein
VPTRNINFEPRPGYNARKTKAIKELVTVLGS